MVYGTSVKNFSLLYVKFLAKNDLKKIRGKVRKCCAVKVQQQVHCESGLVEDLKYINLSGRKPCQGCECNFLTQSSCQGDGWRFGSTSNHKALLYTVMSNSLFEYDVIHVNVCMIKL